MLLFPESVIKAAVDTFKEVAIDDFKSENYERAVKHLTVALSLDEKSHVLYSNRCTAYIALEQYDKAPLEAKASDCRGDHTARAQCLVAVGAAIAKEYGQARRNEARIAQLERWRRALLGGRDEHAQVEAMAVC